MMLISAYEKYRIEKLAFDSGSELVEKPIGLRRASWPETWLYVTVGGYDDRLHYRLTKEEVQERREFCMLGSGTDFRFDMKIEDVCASDWDVVH
jgi:hypothetical protein